MSDPARIVAYLNRRRAAGGETTTQAEVSVVRAAIALGLSDAAIDRGRGDTSLITGAINVPGVAIRSALSGESGADDIRRLDARDIATWAEQSADATQGASTREFRVGLRRILERASDTTLVTRDELRKLLIVLDAGVLAVPQPSTSRTTETRHFNDSRAALAWEELAIATQAAAKAYYKQLRGDAAQQTEIAEAALARWEAIYSAAQAVAELPATLVSGAGELAGKALFSRGGLILLALAAAGLFVFLRLKKASAT